MVMIFEFKSLILLFDGYADRWPAKRGGARRELRSGCQLAGNLPAVYGVLCMGVWVYADAR